jgi:hypothetical protein
VCQGKVGLKRAFGEERFGKRGFLILSRGLAGTKFCFGAVLKKQKRNENKDLDWKKTANFIFYFSIQRVGASAFPTRFSES